MLKTIQFYFYLLATSIRAATSNRGAYLMEAGLMVANNLIFLAMWWLFFNEFRTVGHWQMQDMAALFAIGGGAYGLFSICFGGTRNIARMILNGGLDSFMTQPKNLLLHIAGSKSSAKGWGHLMTSTLLILFGGFATVKTALLVIICMITGSLIFASMRVISHSLCFWLGPIETLSEKYADSLFVFALYPTNIYSDVLQLVMFTCIPAGVITYLPVELIRAFSWAKLCTLFVAASIFCALAFFVFYRGLKRYESGNQFGARV